MTRTRRKEGKGNGDEKKEETSGITKKEKKVN